MTTISVNQPHQSHQWSKKKCIIMLGEGMPWNIIMVFFIIGVFAGINGGKKDKKKKEEETNQEKIEV